MRHGKGLSDTGRHPHVSGEKESGLIPPLSLWTSYTDVYSNRHRERSKITTIVHFHAAKPGRVLLRRGARLEYIFQVYRAAILLVAFN
jgi:hypothetical protein